MLNVPKKANDAMHLSLLEQCDVSVDSLGDVVLQDGFHVVDPKHLIRKGRDRHIFLFELYLLFAKEVKDNNGKAKYIYKNKLMVSTIILISKFFKNKINFLLIDIPIETHYLFCICSTQKRWQTIFIIFNNFRLQN